MNETKNPWKILSEKLVYNNKWISVTEYYVINPNGGGGIYGKVHFKSTAIGIIPLDDQLNTYLVGQYRFPLSAYSWEIPEGGGMDTEHALESAKRELLEETGLIAEEWTDIQHLHLSNSVSDEFGIIYMARRLEQRTAMPDETEQLVVKKIPFEHAYNMVKEGAITDSITVAAILRIKLMLSEGQIS